MLIEALTDMSKAIVGIVLYFGCGLFFEGIRFTIRKVKGIAPEESFKDHLQTESAPFGILLWPIFLIVGLITYLIKLRKDK